MSKVFLAALIFIGSINLHADEGMFMPFNLKSHYKSMKAAGLEISYKQIYNPKKPSVKDAIVSLGGFCTAEIISPKGLMLTNHHCGYDAIRENSTPENNILKNGFWAENLSAEKPVPGLTASIVVRMEDVTSQILKALNGVTDPNARMFKFNEIADELKKNAVAGTHYFARIKEFYGGNEYYLIVEEIFTDIRLVGAPPEAIGKYGGNTDNWMWTRHTGDFSMFRIYANNENMPADFSMDNQPYSPKHHLPINISGIEENDFSFIMGYPGSTDRFLTSFGIELATSLEQPNRVKIRGEKLDLMKKNMDLSEATNLQYASTYAQVSNYWKYFIGQTEQLKNNNVLEKKKAIEADFSKWVDADNKRKMKYGNVLKDIEDSYKVLTEFNPTSVYFFESIYSIGLNNFILDHASLYKVMSKETVKDELVKKEVERLSKSASEFWATFDYNTESEIISVMLDLFYKNVPTDQHTPELDSIALEYKEDWAKLVSTNLKNSVFTDSLRHTEFMNNPTLSVFNTDAVFIIMNSLLMKYVNITYVGELPKANSKLEEATKLFIEALREMNPKKKYYPNANFSLRLTYGNILPYTAQGKEYKYFTTIDGLMAKEDPNNEDFIVPARLKELYEKKEYGRYGQDGTLWINFLSNNDITGGNSGSPVMNSKGELIGTAFDGNWEAMSGDISFEKDFQRTISCDIRYVLFIIDTYAGATHLIDEMTIIE